MGHNMHLCNFAKSANVWLSKLIFMSSHPDNSDSFSITMYESLGAHFLLINVFTTSFFETLFFKPCPNFASKSQSLHSENTMISLSGGFWVRQAQREVVKIKNLDFSYWASSTPWGHVLSLKTFYWNPALSWAISYSVFQQVKFTSSFKFVCGNPFSIFWYLMVKFG